jgi:hypothetical protein
MASDSTFVSIRASFQHVENYRSICCTWEHAFLARNAKDNISLEWSKHKIAIITSVTTQP